MRTVGILVILMLLGCVATLAPMDAAPIAPDPLYRVWYDSVAKCAGYPSRDAAFRRLSWYVVPGESFACQAHGGQCVGLWTSQHRIYLADRYKLTGWVVMHEALHDLRGDGAHPPVFDRCNLMP